jgi:hypothetical protein
MSFKKGHVKTGGRTKGTPDKAESRRATAKKVAEFARQEAAIRMEIARLAPRQEIDAAIALMGALTPLEVLLAGMQLKLQRGDVDGAIATAEKAAPYSHARLNATDVRVQMTQRSDAEVTAEIESLRAKIERSSSVPPVMIEGSAEPLAVDGSANHPVSMPIDTE